MRQKNEIITLKRIMFSYLDEILFREIPLENENQKQNL
jgi:hypothetical protein